MIVRKWEKLPECMRADEVRPYYDILRKKPVSLFFKRAFDIVLSVIMLILCALPMIIIAILIKCDSKGPVFYRQERVTTYGKKFRIHKFRTMVNNADKIGTAVTNTKPHGDVVFSGGRTVISVREVEIQGETTIDVGAELEINTR